MKKILALTFFATLIIFSSLSTIQHVYAQDVGNDKTSCLDENNRPQPHLVYVSFLDSCIDSQEAGGIAIIVMIIIGVLAGIYRIASGFFLIVTAEGDPQRLQNGRETITEAIIGILVVVSVYALMQFFEVFIPADWGINLS